MKLKIFLVKYQPEIIRSQVSSHNIHFLGNLEILTLESFAQLIKAKPKQSKNVLQTTKLVFMPAMFNCK